MFHSRVASATFPSGETDLVRIGSLTWATWGTLAIWAMACLMAAASADDVTLCDPGETNTICVWAPLKAGIFCLQQVDDLLRFGAGDGDAVVLGAVPEHAQHHHHDHREQPPGQHPPTVTETPPREAVQVRGQEPSPDLWHANEVSDFAYASTSEDDACAYPGQPPSQPLPRG